jgi:hypothetical protein
MPHADPSAASIMRPRPSPSRKECPISLASPSSCFEEPVSSRLAGPRRPALKLVSCSPQKLDNLLQLGGHTPRLAGSPVGKHPEGGKKGAEGGRGGLDIDEYLGSRGREKARGGSLRLKKASIY